MALESSGCGRSWRGGRLRQWLGALFDPSLELLVVVELVALAQFCLRQQQQQLSQSAARSSQEEDGKGKGGDPGGGCEFAKYT